MAAMMMCLGTRLLVALLVVRGSKGYLASPMSTTSSRWQSSRLKATVSSTEGVENTVAAKLLNRDKRPYSWTFTPLAADKRQQVMDLTKELEQGYFNDTQDDVTFEKWRDGALSVLDQWAQLGEGQRAMEVSNSILKHNNLDKDTILQCHRRVLHAWCNQLKRVSTWDARRRRRSRAEFKELAQNANQALQQMEQLVSKNDELESEDYGAVIRAHAESQQVAPALSVLGRAAGCSQSLTVTTYNALIRSILDPSETQDLLERSGAKVSPIELAHSLLEECKERNDGAPMTHIYNRVLDAWSKTLPQFSKKNAGLDTSTFEHIVKKAEWIWNTMPMRDAWSHVLMIYIYCKSGRALQALSVWELLLDRLLIVSGSKKEPVDSRSFRVLVNALAASAEDHDDKIPSHIDSILEGMWKFHEAGYDDTAPDVFMYTTAMNVHASRGNVTRVVELLDDLESRHRAFPRLNLRRDVATYNALIHAISKQDEVATAAQDAGSVVKVMEREARKNPKVLPDTITYNTLIDACLASKCQEGVERAEQTLLRMENEFKSGNSRVKPGIKTFSVVIEAWVEQGNAARAEALLDRMEERYRPPAFLFEKVIRAWCSQARLNSNQSIEPAQRAKALLSNMEDLFVESGNEALRPSMSLYGDVASSLNEAGDAESADNVLKRREELYASDDVSLDPKRFTSTKEVFDLLQRIEDAPRMKPRLSVEAFNAVISLLSKSGKPWAGQRAEDVLIYMLELHLKQGKTDMAPDIVTFNSVMAAWAKSTDRDAGQKAASVLEKLDKLHEMGLLEDVKADRVSYNTIMSAYAKSSDPNSGSMAEAVFRKLETQYETSQDDSLKPGIVSYTTLLNAWANSRDPYSATRADEILLRMLKEYKAGRSDIMPNTLCFNEVIYAWAKSPLEGASKHAEMVLQLMQDMSAAGGQDVKPDTRSFNLVLYALANSKQEDAPIRAQLLLDRMTDEGRKGNLAMKPDLVSYKTVISAWSNLGGSVAVNASITLLDELYESDIEPDASFFSSLIYSLSKSGAREAPKEAERIVRDLKVRVESGKLDVHLNTDIYNALIHCWGKSGARGAAKRAEKMLRHMEVESSLGNKSVRPNIQSYTAVIDAYAKSRSDDAAKRAEAVLNRMEDDAQIRPNVHTYTALIQNYARSRNIRSKAIHAQSVLQRMKDDYSRGNEDARPNVVAYNAVLNACEFSMGDDTEMEQAFTVACVTLDELRHSKYLGKPNHVTYGTFLGVIAKLMPRSSTRNELVEIVFKRCCADGQLGPLVVKKLLNAATPSLYNKLLGDVDEGGLPAEWTKNVSE